MLLRVTPKDVEKIGVLSTGSDTVAIATGDAPWLPLADWLQKVPWEDHHIQIINTHTSSMGLKDGHNQSSQQVVMDETKKRIFFLIVKVKIKLFILKLRNVQ